MQLPPIYGEFRCVADPELRFAPSGMAVGTVRLVANSRKKVGDEWVNGDVFWIRATAFKQMAENMVESISKGDLVIIIGRIKTEEWEKDGEKKQSPAVLLDHIGPSLSYATAKVNKAERTQGGQSSGGGGGQQSRPAVEDPWASPAGQTDEPPF